MVKGKIYIKFLKQLHKLVKRPTFYRSSVDPYDPYNPYTPYESIVVPYEPIAQEIRNDFASKFAICCVAKPGSENMEDWIKHHQEIGFRDIYIYHSGILDGYTRTLEDHPIKGVHIIEFPYNYEKDYTTSSYADFYRTYRHNYEWVAFINADEYIMLTKEPNIQKVFQKNNYDSYEVVRLNVVQFSDYIQFTRDFDFKADAVVGDDKVVATRKMAKSIVSCKAKGLLFKSYTPTRNKKPIKQCLPNLEPVSDNSSSNRIKGVDVDKIDVSVMYVTPNQMEIRWRKWKKQKGY